MAPVIRHIVIHDYILGLLKRECINARHVVILLGIRIAHYEKLVAPALLEMLARKLSLAVLLQGDLLLNPCRPVISLLILHRRRKAHRRACRNSRRSLLPLSREGSQEGLLRPCQRSA